MKILAAGLLFSLTFCGTALAQPFCDPMPVSIRPTQTFPPYPVEAYRRRETGITEMLVTLNEDGAPLGVEMFRSSGSPRLDEAAVAHVLSVWRWQPTKSSCRPPVRVYWIIR